MSFDRALLSSILINKRHGGESLNERLYKWNECCLYYLYSTIIVTHLHEMSRMSAPYKLRKWALCMIWDNNSEFCFFVKFWCFKAYNYHFFQARNGFYAPILVRNDKLVKNDMIVIIRFFVNLFSKLPLAAILDYTHFKKTTKLTWGRFWK